MTVLEEMGNKELLINNINMALASAKSTKGIRLQIFEAIITYEK